MPRKPNYNFERQKREAAKQKKKNEKRERKRLKKNEPVQDGAPDPEAQAPGPDVPTPPVG